MTPEPKPLADLCSDETALALLQKLRKYPDPAGVQVLIDRAVECGYDREWFNHLLVASIYAKKHLFGSRRSMRRAANRWREQIDYHFGYRILTGDIPF